MAVIVLTDVAVTINAVGLASKATSATLTYEKEAVESTAFGGGGVRSFTAGLTNLTCEITLNQDFAANETEATIYPLVGTTTTVVLKPTSGAVGATNPSYTLTGTYLASHTPINGGVGEMSTTVLTFQGGTLTKATA